MRGEDMIGRRKIRFALGSPPHARGRRSGGIKSSHSPRITPACAGKTGAASARQRAAPDHPRMRGEDDAFAVGGVADFGSPPHARGRHVYDVNSLYPYGITPACAGKTKLLLNGIHFFGDHPRMRGEDTTLFEGAKRVLGSPPHARGRLLNRITAGMLFTDHPRMRGEDRFSKPSTFSDRGSPPHARGRRRHLVRRAVVQRITPACAGKTSRTCPFCQPSTDHPRMRGEDEFIAIPDDVPMGSPPHARGRLQTVLQIREIRRITPACAGKTRFENERSARVRDHPRMRGEDDADIKRAESVAGSPPHARGRLSFDGLVLNSPRITPACAGKTPSRTDRM